jgi:predicted SnoaL-like aldol condensation-catalyzing enzyme
MSKVEEIKAKAAAYKQAMQESGKEAVKELFSEFFGANPEIQAVRWRQYTPYFNDGEPCEFSIHEMYAKPAKAVTAGTGTPVDDDGSNGGEDEDLDDEDEEDGDYKDGFIANYDDNFPKKSKPTFQALERAANELEEVLRLVFGDHVQVIATREGFEVEEYEHE